MISNNMQTFIMNMQNLKLSKFARRAALRGKMEESALHHYSIKFQVGVCPRSPWEVKLQGAAAHTPLSCNFDISARCLSQIVDNLLTVNLRRQSTTWKLECHPELTNSGVRTSQDNYFQEPAKVHHEHAKFENVEICPKGPSQRKNGGECFAPLFY